jgi:putative CocE/NonD family hydrolase
MKSLRGLAGCALLGLAVGSSSLGGQATAASPPPIERAAPRFPVRIEQSVMVPMRDGVRLSTDLYRPTGAGDRLPVILIRTPYDKSAHRRPQSAANWFASQGYVVAVQDVRGKFESEGEYIISAADLDDGPDAVEWLAAQPWSTGRIGTYGCSYLGDVQVMMARRRPAHHAAMVPQAAGSSIPYR